LYEEYEIFTGLRGMHMMSVTPHFPLVLWRSYMKGYRNQVASSSDYYFFLPTIISQNLTILVGSCKSSSE